MKISDNIAKSCNQPIKTIVKNYENILSNLNDTLFDIPQDKKIEKLVGFFDYAIANYIYIYNISFAKLQTKKYYFGDKKYPKDINFSFILMLKLITQDLITLRNLSIIDFDAQFHSISRNFIEKMKIFLLCCYDEEFFEVFTGYKTISDEELYKNYTREKKLDERIEHLLEKYPFDPTIIELSNDELKNRLDNILHPFVHTNNYKQLLKYYAKHRDSKIYMPVKNKNDSNASVQIYKYMCEASILYLINIIIWARNDTKIKLDTHLDEIFNVYQEYMKAYYTK